MPNNKGLIESNTNSIKLDFLDRKLITALCKNVRFTFSFLGKLFLSSKDRIRYRINKLTESQMFLSPILMINPYLFGYSINMISGNFKQLSEQQEQELIIKLTDCPFTIWVGTGIGTFDITIYYLDKKSSIKREIKALLKKKICNLSELSLTGIHSYESLPKWFAKEQGLEDIIMKRKDSSFQKLVKKEPFLKGNKEIIEPIDKEIIKNLSIDCRESIAKISNKMKKPYNSIKYRISYMLKRNIIGSFSSMINLSFLHMIVYAIFIKSLDNNKNLLLHLKNHQNSGWVIETKGNYNLIWYGAVKDFWQLNECLSSIKKQFPSIKELKTMIIKKDYKLTFTPKGLLDNL